MQKIIFSTLSITALFILTAVLSYSEESYTQYKIRLIPGTDKPVIKNCSDFNTIYIYDDYVIYTRPSGDFEGSNIYVFNPLAQDDNPCSVEPQRANYAIQAGEFGGANTFTGVYGNLLFMDQWTGRNFKRLLAINLDNRSLVFFDTYTSPKIRNGELIYLRTLKAKRKSVTDKIPCPNAEEWKARGKQVLYVEKMIVDLSTMKKEPSSKFSCTYTDPIGTAAPKKYGH